jgi:GDP-mannose transporter
MFGNSVTGLTLVSFALIVGSSVIAAWADVNNGATSEKGVTPSAGYIWMALNCFASAAYVSSSYSP